MLKAKFKELQNKLLEETKSFYGDRLVSFAVFGSVAREAFRYDSDIDLLIIAENLPKRSSRNHRAYFKKYALLQSQDHYLFS